MNPQEHAHSRAHASTRAQRFAQGMRMHTCTEIYAGNAHAHSLAAGLFKSPADASEALAHPCFVASTTSLDGPVGMSEP